MNLKDSDGRRPHNYTGYPADKCFYCGEPHPKHKDDCGLVRRSVVLRMSIEFVAAVPQSWDKDQIEFHRNEGTFCSANDIDAVTEALRAQNPDVDGSPCFCFCSRTELVREATEDDHKRLPHGPLETEED